MVILGNKTCTCMYASICFKSYTIFIYRMKCWDFFLWIFFVIFLLEHVSVQCNKYFIFKKKLPLTQSSSLSLTLASYWIGLSDIIQEGTYVWQTTQQRPDFADWGSGEPNDLHHNEDCIELYQVKNFHWNDAPCSVKSKFICEIT